MAWLPSPTRASFVRFPMQRRTSHDSTCSRPSVTTRWSSSGQPGEVKLIRRRHAAYFLELAERIEPALLGAQQRQLLDVLEREHDNLRSALHWAADTGEVGVELRLATALAYFWRMRGHLTEGRRRVGGSPRAVSCRRPLASQGARPVRDATYVGDYERVTPQLDEALVLAHTSDDSLTAAEILASMAVAAWQQQAFDRAVTLSEEGLKLRWRQGDTLGLALALRNLGPQLLSVGKHERARVVLEESLGLFRDLGGQRDCAVILGALADVALVQGDVDRAIALLLESLPLARAVADRRAIAHSATILVEQGPRFGQPERMARLAGALDAWREEMGAIRQASRLAQGVAAVRTALRRAGVQSGRRGGASADPGPGRRRGAGDPRSRHLGGWCADGPRAAC